jgi:AAA+ superfamily predicted ATPase
MSNKTKPNPRPNSESASSLSESGAKIFDYIRAGYPGLYLVSPEEQRVEAEFKSVLDQLNRGRQESERYQLCYWSVVDGLVNMQTKQSREANDPSDVLQAIAEQPEKTVTLLKDYHLFLQDPNPVVLRKFKDVLLQAKTRQKVLVIIGCRLILPPELEREITVIEFSLPGKEQLAVVLDGILESAGIESLEPARREIAIDAASGLTTIEAENVFALSFVQARTIDSAIVSREKALALKKGGLLEIVQCETSLDSVGGLDLLKEWLLQRREAFSKKAVAYGLPTPKGVLILGIPGTGKSLTAKATAAAFGMPLLKLDAGRIFAGLVGQSESNLRSATQTAEAIAPCVLWLDEIEKGFAGSKSSGATDGGTSARVLGSFLNWMQEKKAPVFIVATANDVSQLPPELLRKGRWDELWFVDLPNQAEREAIWKIQIAKHGRNPNDFDCAQLARATDGFTGSEIEGAFVDALYAAFGASNEPTDLEIAQVLTEIVPLSKLMAEQISALRNWSKGRARLATSTESSGRKLRKIAA